ncbi:hypothetical protein CYMTET_28929 [Cymbomonas tetramitiformis]|uniref:Protein transport protein SEC23 n=1 Tax=Cymbomonas tetramitiformis TaxID=36881 RepID=A0AAE0FM00_9CHLO|nr:hypothetical protein CYMTET_28929 [Cymbomonas tetramitiformis]
METSNGSAQVEIERYVPYVNFTASLVPSVVEIANGPVPFGAIFSPLDTGIEYDNAANPPAVLRRDPTRCSKCGAYINRFCAVDPNDGKWTCVFCGSSSAWSYFSPGDFKSSLEMREGVIEWQQQLLPKERSFSSLGSSEVPTPILYAIDETLDEEDLAPLRTALIAALQALPSTTPVGILTYGRSVAAYDLSHSGVAAADVVSGARPPSTAALAPLLYGAGAYFAPVHVCLPIVQAIVGSFRPDGGNIAAAERARCLGAALEVRSCPPLLDPAVETLLPSSCLLACFQAPYLSCLRGTALPTKLAPLH